MAKFGEGAGGTFTLVDTAKFDPTKTTLRDYLKLYIEKSAAKGKTTVEESYSKLFGLNGAKVGTKADVFAKYLDRPMIHMFLDGQDDDPVIFVDKNGEIINVDPDDAASVKHGQTYKGTKVYATSPNALIALSARGKLQVADWSSINGIEENIDNWIKQRNNGNPIEIERTTGELSRYGGDAGSWKITDLVTRPDKHGSYSAKYGYNPLKMGEWFNALAEHVKANPADKGVALALSALAHSGLRPGQIENMAEFHFRGLEENEVPTIFQPDTVQGGKMKVPLNVPIGERLQMIFHQAIENNRSMGINNGDAMFRNSDGSRITTGQMTALIKKIKVKGIKSDLGGEGKQLDSLDTAYDLRRIHATTGALELGIPQQLAALIRGRAIDAIAGSENIYIRAGLGYAGKSTRNAASKMDSFYWGKFTDVLQQTGVKVPEGEIIRPESDIFKWMGTVDTAGDESALLTGKPSDGFEIDLHLPAKASKTYISPDDFDDGPPAGGGASGERNVDSALITDEIEDPDDSWGKKVDEFSTVKKVGKFLSRGFGYAGTGFGIMATKQAFATPSQEYMHGVFGKTGRVVYEAVSTLLPVDPTFGMLGSKVFTTKEEVKAQESSKEYYEKLRTEQRAKIQSQLGQSVITGTNTYNQDINNQEGGQNARQ